MATSLSLTQGTTHTQVVRWGVEPIVYRPITAITQTAPALITSPGHGILPGWPVAVTSVKGMKEINAKYTPPKNNNDPYVSDYKQATVVDADTISLNLVNAADFGAYVSGGYVQFFSPVDITGYTARLAIKNKIGGTEYLRLTTENNGIVIDAVARTITLLITAAQTAALTLGRYHFDLEMVAPDTTTVKAIMSGIVVVAKEVTT